MRAAINARVSTADGWRDTENQLAELSRFASTQDWEIAAEYTEPRQRRSPGPTRIPPHVRGRGSTEVRFGSGLGTRPLYPRVWLKLSSTLNGSPLTGCSL